MFLTNRNAEIVACVLLYNVNKQKAQFSNNSILLKRDFNLNEDRYQKNLFILY